MSHTMLDVVWILFCSILILFMQAGFLCFETGMTRSKNNINVAIKNLMSIILPLILFWGFGFALMFGSSWNGMFGTSQWFLTFTDQHYWWSAFFLFAVLFCATSASIVSGATAERIHFSAYLVIVILIAGLIYPLYGHWAWYESSTTGARGWLKNLGFVDFAGSTVVHSIGGWLALYTIMIIGPRIGRFNADGKHNDFTSSNIPMSVLGVIFLWIGWVGFNGGSTLKLNQQISPIILNTLLAGVAGGIIALIVGWRRSSKPDVILLMNGSLAGMVSITASCHAVSNTTAVLIGIIGSFWMIVINDILLRMRLDDAVGAIPVHLAGGIWGTIAVAIFGDLRILNTGLTRSQQLIIQLLGILVAAVWTYLAGYLILRRINKYFPLRVSRDAEEQGLNVSEHGVRNELYDLLSGMEKQITTNDLNLRLKVEPFTEVGIIAEGYNRVMEALQKALNRSEIIIRDLRDGIITFSKQGIINSANPGAEKLFGYSAAEIIGLSIMKIIAQQPGFSIPLNSFNINEYIRMNTDSSPTKNVFLARRKNQTTFPIEMTVNLSKMEKEIVYTGLVRDITEQQKMEIQASIYLQQLEREKETLNVTRNSLQEQVVKLNKARRATLNLLQDHREMRLEAEQAVKRYSSLSNSSPMGIFEMDRDGKIIYVNPRWQSITGLNAEQVIQKYAREVFLDQDQEKFSQLFKTDMSAEADDTWEMQILSPTNKLIWVNVRVTSIHDDHGAISSYVGTFEDISNRKSTEIELYKLSSAVKQTADNVMITNHSGIIEFVNPSFVQLTGYEPEEVLGHTPRILKSGEHPAEYYENLWSTILSGNVFRDIFKNRKKNGQLYYEQKTITPIINDRGEIVQYLSTGEDITEQVMAENRLKQSLDEKVVLLQEIHHRVKNNLQVITSILNLQSSNISDPHTIEIFRESQHRIRSMALIHERLYGSSDLARVDISGYISSIISFLCGSYKIDTNKIHITIAVEPIALGIDTALPCGLIITELVSNSIKYAFTQEYFNQDHLKATIMIALTAEQNQEYLLVISDNGIGIPVNFNLSQPATLGLKLVHALVKQLDGSIDLTRQNGTEFHIKFKQI